MRRLWLYNCVYLKLKKHKNRYMNSIDFILRATPTAAGPSLHESIRYCFWLEWSLVASWYGPSLSAGTERRSQLVQIVALSWYRSLLPAGTESCSGKERCFQLLLPAGKES